jgi:hypothetical protein
MKYITIYFRSENTYTVIKQDSPCITYKNDEHVAVYYGEAVYDGLIIGRSGRLFSSTVHDSVMLSQSNETTAENTFFLF